MQLNKVLAALLLGASTIALAAPAPQDDSSSTDPSSSTTSSSDDGSDVTPDSTLPPESANCGGRWGSVTNQQAVLNAFNYLKNHGGQACTTPNTCRPVLAQPCVNGVRMGFCNTVSLLEKKVVVPYGSADDRRQNDYGKCLDYSDLYTRAEDVASYCYEHSQDNNAGQGFFRDGTNFIIQHC